MGILAEALKLHMMDSKECMTGCKEFRKFNATGKPTLECQKCPNYAAVYKKALVQVTTSGSSTLS